MRTRRTPKVNSADSPTASKARAVRKTKSALLISTLRLLEKRARIQLDQGYSDTFDRGYYLGMAHAYSHTRGFIVKAMAK